MPGHKIGTREEWQAVREELGRLEAEQATRNEEIKRKRRELPWVPVEKEYVFDTQALTEEQAEQIPEVRQMVENPPEWLEFWASQIGAELKDRIRENPGYIAFAKDYETVYHTYTVSAPDPFVAPYFNFLLERAPRQQPAEPLNYRKDEYPN